MLALLINKFIAFLLPPVGLLVMATLGFAVQRRHPRVGRYLIGWSLALLWLVSTPAFVYSALEALEWPVPADLREASGAQAIVVLSGGLYPLAPEYGGADTVGARTLQRVRYAAHLHRQTGLPVLATGGRPYGRASAEAEVMKSVLENEFATPVRWIEVESQNTLENARASARILRDAGVRKVFLITEAFHMRRAIQAFAPTGIEVIPAATEFETRWIGYQDFLPGMAGFGTSHAIAHELVGRAWYAIRLRLE